MAERVVIPERFAPPKEITAATLARFGVTPAQVGLVVPGAPKPVVGRPSFFAAGFGPAPVAVARAAEAAADVRRIELEKAGAVSEVSRVEDAAAGLEREHSGIEAARSRLEADRAEVERLSVSRVAPAPFVRTRVERFNQQAAALNARVGAFNTRIGVVEEQAAVAGERASEAGVAGPRGVVVSEAVPVERFSPEAARELVRERIEEPFRVRELRVAAVRGERPEVARELARAVVGFPTAPAVAAAGVFTGLAGFGFGAIAERGIEEAERIKAMPFRLEVPIGFEPERLTVLGKEEIVTVAQFAGEFAGISALFMAPKLAKLPEFGLRPLGVKGELILFGRKPPKKLPMLEIEIPPRVARKVSKELRPALAEARAELAKIKPLPGEVRLELPRRVPAKVGVELKRAILEAVPVRFRAPKPFKLTPFKPTTEELAILRKTVSGPGVFGIEVEKIVKLPPKVPTVLRPAVLEVTKEEAASIKFLQQQVKAAMARVVVKPVEAVELQRIPGAALTLGLRAGRVVEEKIKPEFMEIGFEIFRPIVPEAALRKFVEVERVKLAPAVRVAGLERLALLPKQKLGELAAEVSITAVTPVEITRIAEAQRVVEAQRLAELQKLVEVQQLRTIFRQPPRIVRRPPPPEEPFKKPPKLPKIPPFILMFPPVPRKLKKRVVRRRVPGFDTFLKIRGTFRKQNPRPLHRSTALALGAHLADRASPATFKVVQARKPATGKKRKPNLRKFRKPVRKGRTISGSPLWIERNKFRIDSPGEKQQITAKGLAALRTGFFKKKKKRKTKRRKR